MYQRSALLDEIRYQKLVLYQKGAFRLSETVNQLHQSFSTHQQSHPTEHQQENVPETETADDTSLSGMQFTLAGRTRC